MTEALDHPFFAAQLEQIFQAEIDSEEVLLKLIKLDILPKNDQQEQIREPFSLVFRGSKDQQLQQGTFFLNNKNIASSIAVFLVPIGADDQGLCYEAVFN